jgi:hypothetical protein
MSEPKARMGPGRMLVDAEGDVPKEKGRTSDSHGG